MGLFIKNYQIIKEVEVNGQKVGDDKETNDYTSANDSGEESNNNQNNNASDNNEEDTTTDYTKDTEETDDNQNTDNDQNNDQDNNEEDTTDYTQMDDENTEDNPDDTGEGTDETNNSGDDTTSGGDEEPQEVDDIKAKEEELFKNLTPEQLDIKHRELKNKFLDMFDMVNNIIERIGNMSVEEISTIEYISNTLSNLRTMLTDYVNSVYKTKSYTENLINYNRFLAVLNGVGKILEEIGKKKD